MNNSVTPALDWTLAQSFALVLDTGSLSAAARASGQSQPTVGRHIRALERALGVELFTRGAQGLVPTPAALALAPHVRAMAQAARALSLAAAGEVQDLAGTVRITASVVVSHFILPGILSELRHAYPQIQIELVASDTSENLLFREADIAIRMYRPQQLDVITRHIGDMPIRLYGQSGYLDRVGRPKTVDDLLALDFIGFDKNDTIIRAMRGMGFPVDRDFFALRTDDQAAFWQAVRAGLGVGAMQRVIGDADPLVEPVLADQIVLPSLPVWLTAHQALHLNPRIRAVWDGLALGLERIVRSAPH